MSKFKHPVSGLLYGCLACYERDGDNRLNKHLSQADIAENIRVAIDSLEADTPVKPGSGCPEGYGLEEGVQLKARNIACIRALLAGDQDCIYGAFKWSDEKHGSIYWANRGQFPKAKPLSDTDKDFLRFLLQAGDPNHNRCARCEQIEHVDHLSIQGLCPTCHEDMGG